MKKVDKVEFDNFIQKYSNKLEKNVDKIIDPPIINYHDFSLDNNCYKNIVAYITTDYYTLQPKDYYIKI